MRRKRVLYVDSKAAGLRIEAGQSALLFSSVGCAFKRSPSEITGVH